MYVYVEDVIMGSKNTPTYVAYNCNTLNNRLHQLKYYSVEDSVFSSKCSKNFPVSVRHFCINLWALHLRATGLGHCTDLVYGLDGR